jgi:hypothetical protein
MEATATVEAAAAMPATAAVTCCVRRLQGHGKETGRRRDDRDTGELRTQILQVSVLHTQ